MNAVRYFSRTGNTKEMAEAIADELGIEAVSVDDPEAVLTEYVDVLFVGGALYKFGLDEHLSSYLNRLDPDLVGKVVIFSTTWFSKRSIELMVNILLEKGIEMDPGAFYVRGKPNKTHLKAIREFANEHAD